MSLPTVIQEQAIDTAALVTALEGQLSRHFGMRRRIVHLERRPSPYHSSYSLEELQVTLEGGHPLQLIIKDLSRQALLEAARGAKPAFLYNPLREIETYRVILEGSRLGTAVC